eukprot:135052-Amphidinium_carterae.1
MGLGYSCVVLYSNHSRLTPDAHEDVLVGEYGHILARVKAELKGHISTAVIRGEQRRVIGMLGESCVENLNLAETRTLRQSCARCGVPLCALQHSTCFLSTRSY